MPLTDYVPGMIDHSLYGDDQWAYFGNTPNVDFGTRWDASNVEQVFNLVNAAGTVVIALGDAAAATGFEIRDSAGVVQWSVDSDGAIASTSAAWVQSVALVWTLLDNTATALTVATSGDSDMMVFDTTDAASRITIGAVAGLQILDSSSFRLGSGSDILYTPDGTDVVVSNQGSSRLQFHDDVFYIVDPADITKELRIDVGAVTTGTTRLMTIPDRDVDLTHALQVQQTTVTAAQIRAIETTPITIVAAPGAGLVAVLVALVLELDYGATAHDDAAADGNLVAQYVTSDNVIATIEADGFIDAVADAISVAAVGAGAAVIQNVIAAANDGIELLNDGAAYTGTGDGVLDVTAYYMITTSQL